MRLCAAVLCLMWLMCPTLGATSEPKVVCYWRSKAVTNIGYQKMLPSEIDPNLCTHLIYIYVGITEDGNVTIENPRIDLPDKGGKAGFQKLNALRKRNEKLKTLVSSGSNDGAPAKYSKIAADASLRSKYAKNVVEFVLRHEFDGFDISWQWPTRGGGSPDDVWNFVLLLKEIRESFDEHKLILSTTVEALELFATDFYNIPEISKYVDFIVLMAKFRNIAASTTGHLGALYPSTKETSSRELTRNCDSALQYWLSEGAPAEKLILSAQFYGLGFVLQNTVEHGIGSGTVRGSSSDYTDKSYNEICKLVSQDAWNTVWDEEQRVPYSWSGNHWISYENAGSCIEKGKYAQAMGLGGVAAWAIDEDDHRGQCGEPYPLINGLICGLRETNCTFIPTPQVASTPAIVSTTPKIDMTVDANADAQRTCAKFNIKYVRHPQDFASFWICREIRENEFHAEPFKCGAGLFFDTRKIICKQQI